MKENVRKMLDKFINRVDVTVSVMLGHEEYNDRGTPVNTTYSPRLNLVSAEAVEEYAKDWGWMATIRTFRIFDDIHRSWRPWMEPNDIKRMYYYDVHLTNGEEFTVSYAMDNERYNKEWGGPMSGVAIAVVDVLNSLPESERVSYLNERSGSQPA